MGILVMAKGEDRLKRVFYRERSAMYRPEKTSKAPRAEVGVIEAGFRKPFCDNEAIPPYGEMKDTQAPGVGNAHVLVQWHQCRA
jgi:hypothetical protein